MSEQEPSAVLVLEGPLSGGPRETCFDLLTGGKDSRSVLSVRYDGSVEEYARQLRSHPHDVSSAAFVAVRSTTSEYQNNTVVRTVSDPADLTGIGVAVLEWLSARSSEEDPAVCIDSGSEMVQYTDVERVFRLLHALVGKCHDHGASIHVHLTPSAHDDRTVATLRQLFDEQRRIPSAGSGAETDASVATAGVDGVAGRHGD